MSEYSTFEVWGCIFKTNVKIKCLSLLADRGWKETKIALIFILTMYIVAVAGRVCKGKFGISLRNHLSFFKPGENVAFKPASWNFQIS